MNAVNTFNGLNGKIVSREELVSIIELAKKQEQPEVIDRLQLVLDQYDFDQFEIDLNRPAVECVPASLLPLLDEAPELPKEDHGLGKAVSPDDIYQYITDLMLNTIKVANKLPWQTMWEESSLGNGKQATNYESKKAYRGINFFLLNFELKFDKEKGFYMDWKNWENPYFLTFNQVEKYGGKIKEGTKAYRVVYFTRLYKFEAELEDGKKIEFGTYDQKKWIAWLKENKSVVEKTTGTPIEVIAADYIPILKYYNVFNGGDVEGIDFKEPPANPNASKSENEKIEVAEAIVKSYPNPPDVKMVGNQPAYYPKSDRILMTPIEQFKNPQFFYSVFFHELTHSTGHSKRLNRGNDTRKRDGSKADKKAYDFEELVAEMGAVFLCAESGILFQTRDQSAVYLRHYLQKLTDRMEEDNRFFFRAASASQAAADHILNRDKEGNPAYLKTLKVDTKINKNGQKKSKAVPNVTKTVTKPKPTTKKLTRAELEAANPKGFAKKPKSVAVTTAIKDVLSLPKYKGKINERQAAILYKHFKDSAFGSEIFSDVTSDYERGILKKENELYDFDISNDQLEITEFGMEFVQAVNARRESLLNQKHNLALFDGLKGKRNEHIKINTDKFKNMSVPELRKFTFDYYNQILKGNKAKIKTHIKEVHFISDSGRKILKPMYKEKAAVIEHLEHLIKNSSYNNWGDRKTNDNPTVLGYLNFKSKVVIDGIKRHVRIAISLNRDREKLFKSFEVGAKSKEVKHPGTTVVGSKDGGIKPLSKNKDTKKTIPTKKGLKSPAAIEVQKEPIIPLQPEPQPPAQQDRGGQVVPEAPVNNKVRNMAAKPSAGNSQFYTVAGEVGKFLQLVERKPKESVVITLDGEQGAGKTTTLYQFMDAFAKGGNRGIFFSLEEHHESVLAQDKADRYLSPESQKMIDIVSEIDNQEDFYNMVGSYDVIFLDSWQKLQRMIGAIRLDEDLRKKFDGKVFVIIFQQTTTGRTKGGSEVVFDGDIIIKMVKEATFNENYAYFDKNRYTKIPLENLRYNIAGAYVYNPNETHEEPETEEPTAVEEIPGFSITEVQI